MEKDQLAHLGKTKPRQCWRSTAENMNMSDLYEHFKSQDLIQPRLLFIVIKCARHSSSFLYYFTVQQHRATVHFEFGKLHCPQCSMNK